MSRDKEVAVRIIHMLSDENLKAEDSLRILHRAFTAILISASRHYGMGIEDVYATLDSFTASTKEMVDERLKIN